MKIILGILAGFSLLCMTGCNLDGGGGGGSAALVYTDPSNETTSDMISTNPYLTDNSTLFTYSDLSGYEATSLAMLSTISFEDESNGLGSNSTVSTAPVPEPATMFLLTMGLGGLAAMRLRRRKSGDR